VSTFQRGAVKLCVVSRRVRSGAPLEELSAAENAVCQLALGGLDNRAIAEARGTSVRTVANQLASIYKKLDAPGRWGLPTAIAARRTD